MAAETQPQIQAPLENVQSVLEDAADVLKACREFLERNGRGTSSKVLAEDCDFMLSRIQPHIAK